VDVECKLGCVNLRRVSDPGRAFRQVIRGTGIADDWYRSTIGVIVISLGTPGSAGENFGCTWEHMGVPATTLEAPATSLGTPMTSLEAPGSTSKHCKAGWENDVFFRNIAATPGYHSYYLSLVLATVPDRHFGAGSGSKPNRCQIGGPGRH